MTNDLSIKLFKIVFARRDSGNIAIFNAYNFPHLKNGNVLDDSTIDMYMYL